MWYFHNIARTSSLFEGKIYHSYVVGILAPLAITTALALASDFPAPLFMYSTQPSGSNDTGGGSEKVVLRSPEKGRIGTRG
jgi:hypothetical protein